MVRSQYGQKCTLNDWDGQNSFNNGHQDSFYAYQVCQESQQIGQECCQDSQYGYKEGQQELLDGRIHQDNRVDLDVDFGKSIVIKFV